MGPFDSAGHWQTTLGAARVLAAKITKSDPLFQLFFAKIVLERGELHRLQEPGYDDFIFGLVFDCVAVPRKR